MEFRQLKYFIAIADSSSFSKASQNLYVSQSTLSQQIVKLEQELGVVLLERSTRSVKLTVAGQCLYRQSIGLLKDMESMIQMVKMAVQDTAYTRKLKVGIEDSIFSLEYTGALDALGRIRKEIPALDIDYFPSFAGNLQRAVAENQADFAICYLPNTEKTPSGMQERCFNKGSLAFAVPADWGFREESPAFYKKVGEESVLFPEERSYWHGLMTSVLAANNCHPRFTSVINYASAKNFVAAGQNIFFAPEVHLRREAGENVAIIPINSPLAEYRVSVLYSEASRDSLLESVLQYFPEKGKVI